MAVVRFTAVTTAGLEAVNGRSHTCGRASLPPYTHTMTGLAKPNRGICSTQNVEQNGIWASTTSPQHLEQQLLAALHSIVAVPGVVDINVDVDPYVNRPNNNTMPFIHHHQMEDPLLLLLTLAPTTASGRYVTTNKMMADFFTKPSDKTTFFRCRSYVMNLPDV